LTVYWAALCLGTHLPGSVVVALPVSDKVLHFAAYAGLGFLLALLALRLGLRGWRVHAALLLIAVCYGTIDELGQIPVPGRTADMADWGADILGFAAGLALHWLAVRVAAIWGKTQLEQHEKPSLP
jgi:VanZ family protein